MMDDVVLQVLLILAYLAIGLIAITFPIYAICVTFLPQERWESEKERKKRIEKLRAKISELTAELKGEQHDSGRVAQLKEQLGRYESELKGTEMRDYYLTARGAVGQPVIYLALALLSAGLGMYSFELEILEGVIAFGFFSGLCSAMAVNRLYKTVTAVEYAALRPARTVDFEIGFDEIGEMTKKVKLKTGTEVTTLARSDEGDVENVVLQMRFPNEIELSLQTNVPHIIASPYPEYTIIGIYKQFVPRGIAFGLRGFATAKKTGKYIVDVKICGKGIHEVRKELTLEVVK